MNNSPYGLEETEFKTKDGLSIYFFDQFFSTVLALAGPSNYKEEIDINKLPEGFKWIETTEIQMFLNL
jgi:hypothetical protein